MNRSKHSPPVAGVELDERIAVEVMAWSRPVGSWSTYWLADGKATDYLCADSEDYYDHSPAWSPSTSIEDAWLLVEKFKMVVYPCSTWWCAKLRDWQDSDSASGEDAPLAICRCALQAVAREAEINRRRAAWEERKNLMDQARCP